MFGMLLEVDQIISFGPLSFLNSKQALLYHDRRWLAVMRKLENNLPLSGYYDLPALCLEHNAAKTRLDIFFGTLPDGAGATESVGLDALHAQRFCVFKNCHLHPFPDAPHAVVQYLIERNRINHLLTKYILDVDLPETINVLTEDWLTWAKTNISLGVPLQQVIDILVSHGFALQDSVAAVDKIVSRKTE